MPALLPQLQRELGAAARRSQPRRAPRRLLAITVAVLLLAASVALAAHEIRTGTAAPDTVGVGSPIQGPGHPVAGTVRVLDLRSPDPDGGPPWGIRVYRTSRGAACWQVGRVLNGQLGVIGADGLLNDDGLFHALPVERDQCRPLDGAGQLFAFQELIGLGNGLASGSSCDPPKIAAIEHKPVCPTGAGRLVYLGFLGPEARTVRLGGGPAVRVDSRNESAFLFVTPLEQSDRAPLKPVVATYADGRARTVRDVAPLETVRNGERRTRLPPGFVAPETSLPSPARVRTPVTVERGRWGANTVFRVRFRVPVAVRRYGVDYTLTIDGTPHTTGRRCEDTMRFGGFNIDRNVRAGQTITMNISPAIALRWNRGWCPGHYRGAVLLHDRKHTLDTFSFTIARR